MLDYETLRLIWWLLIGIIWWHLWSPTGLIWGWLPVAADRA